MFTIHTTNSHKNCGQMNTLNSKKLKNPFMYYSAFKLSVYFNNNKHQCKPFHSIETQTTFNQVLYNKVKEIHLDRRAGYHHCIDLINDMAPKVHVALLWDAFEENICLSKFNGGKWRHIIEPDFSANYVQISKQFSIKNNIVLLHDLPTNKLFENVKF